MFWYFIAVYIIINTTLHGRLDIRNFSSSVEKYFSTLEEKFRIPARPCNILYISVTGLRWGVLTAFCFLQLVTRSLLHLCVRYPAHQPVHLLAMTRAASRVIQWVINSLITCLPLLQFQSQSQSQEPALTPARTVVHLLDALQPAATRYTTLHLINTVNVTTPQDQWREQRNTTSSTNFTGRIEKKSEQKWIEPEKKKKTNVVVCF